MKYDPLKALGEKRLAHYKSLKKNHDHSHSIIGEQLYSIQTHFIFELLQNAEDEGATRVKISFDSEKFVFEHNGRSFDIDDIEAITSFGNNERKKLKSNAIGRFGIGFKSVFSVTEKPEIKSGDFNFAISNFIIPIRIDFTKSRSTTITLPLKKTKRNQIISEVDDTLNKLNSSYLLFLSNIKSIEIANWMNQTYSRSIILRKSNIKNSTLKIYSIDEGENQKEFLLFDDYVLIGKKKLLIKISYSINRKRNKIEFEKIDSSPLFAFFSTDKETNLPFYIHAPFITTPARDNIVEGDERNKRLFIALSALMIKTIELLKANNLIDLKTWLVFPCNTSFYNNAIYKIFCNSFSRYLLKNHTMILPTDYGDFCNILDAMKSKSNDIQNLINTREAKTFFGRTHWVTQKIHEESFKIINDWLEVYKVPTIGYWELCEKLDDSFFAKRTDKWLLNFYSCISDEKKLWGIGDKRNPVGPLRNKAFIRTSKNETIKVFDPQGNVCVYLPTKGTSNYQFVKPVFLEGKESKKLFKSLNINIPDLIAEVNEHVITRIEKTTTPYKGLREDILKIFRAIRKADDNEVKILVHKLKNIAWLPGRNNLNKKIALYKPDEIYYPSRSLKLFLNKSLTATFLDQSLFTDHKSKQNARGVFEDVGIFFQPRRFYMQNQELIFENKDALKQNHWNGAQIELEGLKEFLLKSINKKASLVLWNMLLKCLKNWKQSGFDHTMFIQTLKETKWLFNKFGQRLRPSEITPSEFDDAYETSHILMDLLNFKADEIKNFELEHGGKFLSNDELQQLKNEIEELRRENERLKNLYESENEDNIDNELPDIKYIKSTEISLSESQISHNIPEGHQIDGSEFGGEIGFKEYLKRSSPSNHQKKIGIRGEEYVIKLLMEAHKLDRTIEIVNLNENDKIGVGCDIILRKNGIAKILIEVKTTEGGYENAFMISEKQWLTAIKSHLSIDEPEYHIYCVYYAGGTNPQHVVIKDPIACMFEGKLRFVEQWFKALIKR